MTEPTASDAVRSPGERRRLLILAVLVALVAGVLGLDAAIADRSRSSASDEGEPATMAPPASAASSTWYCPGGSAAPDGPADTVVVAANSTGTAITGRITVFSAGAERRQIPVTVPAFGRVSLRNQDVAPGAWTGAIAEFDAGGVAVEQVLTGALGQAVGPCATTMARNWYFATGSTERDDRMVLSLFNPFPEDAIADLAFATDEGQAAPDAFQGVVVPGGSVRAVEVGEHVRRRNAVAATVTVRRGRLIAGRVQMYGARGLTSAVGVPEPALAWAFPDGAVADGAVERYHFYNPSDREALVDLELALDEGAVEPFEIAVPAFDRVTMTLNEESRIPQGVGFSTIVRARNDVPVIVERTSIGAEPGARRGVADTVGAVASARQWILAAGAATEAVDMWVTVHNLDSDTARVTFTLLAGQPLPVSALQDLEIAGGSRLTIRLGDHTSQAELGVVVESSTPVVVERGLYRVGAVGLSRSTGVPVRPVRARS